MNRRKQRGQAIVITLVLVGVVASATAWMLAQIQKTDEYLRYPRIKGRQTIQRAKIISALTVPVLYNCTAAVSAVQTCTLNTNALRGLLESPEGADCSAYVPEAGELTPLNNRCGFSIRQANAATPLLDLNTRVFRGQLHYMGTEISIADSVINFSIPGELLTADIALCPAATPLLKGFAANGDPICQGFTAPTSCGPGEFVKTIDPVTLQVTCHNYVSGITCDPTNSFIGTLQYSGGVYSGACAPRQNPWIYYDLNPENFLVINTNTVRHPPNIGAAYNWGTAPVPQVAPRGCGLPPACPLN